MRKIVIQEFVSLDGMAAGPNDSVDFIPASTQGDRTFGREQVALMDSTDTLLLGRVTYGMFAGFWPNVTEGEEKEFADRFNALEKVVFSKTLERAPWGRWSQGRIVRGGVVDEVTRLKRESGKNILVSGSISIAQALIDQGLVDEYRLVICPVVLGRGRPLFRNGVAPIEMRLVNANVLDRGAVSLIYGQRAAAG
jgi:dihydrofolate reductase